jgi:hypothetical protein
MALFTDLTAAIGGGTTAGSATQTNTQTGKSKKSAASKSNTGKSS